MHPVKYVAASLLPETCAITERLRENDPVPFCHSPGHYDLSCHFYARKESIMLNGTPVELPAMLMAREARAEAQKACQAAHPGCTLISFGLNIPGPVKTNEELRRLFDDGLAAIEELLHGLQTPAIAQFTHHAATGDEALLAVQGEPGAIKAATTRLEETHPLGRLFDIDVLASDGYKLSRPVPRRCLLCDAQAQICARSRRHSVEALTTRIAAMLQDYFHN